MEKQSLYIYKLDTHGNKVKFPNDTMTAKLGEYTYTTQRMAGTPTLTATLNYPTCLDEEWSGEEFVEFRGERYYVGQVPTSSKDNKSIMYKHELQFVSERIVLENAYLFDVVTDGEDTYHSNSTTVKFMGDIHEFVARLNASMAKSGIGYSVVIDEGITSESKLVSLDNAYLAEALQSIYTIYGLPYYFVGKVCHIGYTENVISTPFEYRKGLVSIKKTNANYKIVNRVTGLGNTDNIPFYYPNDDATGTIERSQNLMPSIYRETGGAERFYNALNGTYKIPGTNDYYTFKNLYSKQKVKEIKVDFSDIKPTIEGVTNASGQLIGEIADVAFDQNDSDELGKGSGNNVFKGTDEYVHSYFYIKLHVYNGEYGFNLFEQGLEGGTAVLNMTTGNCAACEFEIGVTYKDSEPYRAFNPVLVDENGNLPAGDFEQKVTYHTSQYVERQQDTSANEVWIAVKKDNTSFGVLMPNATNNYRPSVGDKFVITGIKMPKQYIIAAEDRLEEALIKYMSENNDEKFTFSVNFSRVFLAENEHLSDILNENARMYIKYNSKEYLMYVNSYTCRADKNFLYDISVELTDKLSANVSALRSTITEIAGDIIGETLDGANRNNDWIAKATRMFLRRDKDDTASGLITFIKGGVIVHNEILKPIKNVVRSIDTQGEQTIDDESVPTTAFVQESGDNRYMRKSFEDIASEIHTFLKGWRAGNFVSGATGAELSIDPVTGHSMLEIDKLLVRMTAYFESLTIYKKNSIEGEFMVTKAGGVTLAEVWTTGDLELAQKFVAENGGKITQENTFGLLLEENVVVSNGVPEGVYRCFFRADEDEELSDNQFRAGLLVTAETFNVSVGTTGKVGNQYWWRLVLDASTEPVTIGNNKYHWVDLSISTCADGSLAPLKGDKMVHLGAMTQWTGLDGTIVKDALNEDYQDAIIQSTIGSMSPSITVYEGIDGFTLKDKDYVAYGVDSTKHRAYMRVYGDFYVGDREETNYLQYTMDGGLEFKGGLSSGTTLGGKDLGTTISEAESAANTASANASAAKTAADKANNLLADIASDAKLTPDEKQQVKKEWDIIVSELSKNKAAAAKYSVATTAYEAAYTALGNYITPLLADLTTTSDIVGEAFRAKFKAYYDARTDLLNAISAAAKKALDDLGDRLSYTDEDGNVIIDMKSSLNVTKKLISASVTSTKEYASDVANAAVDGLTIGGKNLLSQTNQAASSRWSYAYGSNAPTRTFEADIDEPKITRVKFVSNGVASGYAVINYLLYSNVLYIPHNAYVTISFDIWVTASLPSFYVNICRQTGAGLIATFGSKAIEANKWVHVVMTAKTATDSSLYTNDQSIYFANTNMASGAALYIKNLKLEAGNKATSWSPAPEDIQSYADGIVGTLRTETTTSLNVLDGKIEGKVESTDYLRSTDNNRLLAACAAGRMLYINPTFRDGVKTADGADVGVFNGITVYDNNKSGKISLTRPSMAAPNDSNYVIKIVTSGAGTSPGLGGFLFRTQTKHGQETICKLKAKIPVGYNLQFLTNYIGGGTEKTKWLTSNKGTGDWAEYAHYVKTGTQGTIGTTHLYALYHDSNSPTYPVEWYLCFATVYDITSVTDLNTVLASHKTLIAQNKSSIDLLATRTSGVEGRLKTAESNISLMPDQIKQSVKTTYIDALNNTVNAHSASIKTNADNIALKVNTTDFTALQGKVVKYTRELVDLMGLDNAKYYPVCIGLSPSKGVYTIEVFRTLDNSYGVPSYATHASGFMLECKWQTLGSGWGANVVDRKIVGLCYSFVSGNVSPIGDIGQVIQNSTEYVYLRGGSKYLIEVGNISHSPAIVLYSAGKTWTFSATNETVTLGIKTSVAPPALNAYLGASITTSGDTISLFGKRIALSGMVQFTSISGLTDYVVGKANDAKSGAISAASTDATTKANNALAGANTYTDTSVVTSRNSLAMAMGYTNWSDMYNKASAGKTIINGGYVRTELLDVKNIICTTIHAEAGWVSCFDITARNYMKATSGAKTMTLSAGNIGFADTAEKVNVRFGTETLSSASGASACMYVGKNKTISGSIGANVGIVFDIENATSYDSVTMTGNIAIWMMKGCIAGFRKRLRRVNANTTLDTNDCNILCVAKDISITLPSTAEDGQEYWIRNCTTGAIYIKSVRSNIYPFTDTSLTTNSVTLNKGNAAKIVYDAANGKWWPNLFGQW